MVKIIPANVYKRGMVITKNYKKERKKQRKQDEYFDVRAISDLKIYRLTLRVPKTKMFWKVNAICVGTLSGETNLESECFLYFQCGGPEMIFLFQSI